MLIETGYGLSPRLTGVKGASAPEYLDSIEPSTCCDLDATIEASYGGTGQTWANLTPTPADGSAQSDYNATNNGFTFTGTAGDPSAYWLADGLQYFNMPLNGIFDKMHRTDQPNGFWIARAYRYVEGQPYFSTFGSGTWNATGDVGISDWETFGNNDVAFKHSDGVSPYTSVQEGSLTADGTDYVSIVSFDLSQSTNNVKFWFSKTTGVTASMAANPTTVGASEGFFGIGATANEGAAKGNMSSGARLYSFAAGNDFLDDTKAQAIIAHLEARHGRDYTP